MKNDEKAVIAELKSSSTGFVFLPFTLISNRQSSILHSPFYTVQDQLLAFIISKL